MRAIGFLAGFVLLAACGSVPANPASPASGVRYQADLTVLSDAGHGPQLCWEVQTSAPPQCAGPDIVGWDWSAVEHTEERGTRWGRYHVVGTWDGARLTLTEPPGPVDPDAERGEETDLRSSCTAPPGGWRPVDPAKATEKAMRAAIRRAERLDGHAATWLDQSYLDTVDGFDLDDPDSVERYGNDSKRLVLNLLFTGDPTRHEAAIRELWGGALCLGRAERSAAELAEATKRAEKEITDRVYVVTDGRAGRVEIGLWVATPERQREANRRYGEGVVVLRGLLQPVTG
ncbi:hypothetical protein HII36_02565 [Nonomuraea sp. NN258]|uniref:hypothetical protein n=1 Tax=Nonomuraea antri TaxID=2730852 RepID=UPI00156A0DE3|nr:hypothetical protein [Nonomuraea antri]NRQ30721.1 hypothetical protein [Nonomuraea antri]